MHLVFWQPIPSFHQEGFFCALAQADWVDSVTLKYESELPADRRQSGWREGVFQGVKLEQIHASEHPEDSAEHVHIFTGFNTHPKIWAAFHRLPFNAQCRRFAFAEAPEAHGLVGLLRRLKYRWAARCLSDRLDGMLALGELGVDFYRSVLPQSVPVYQFAYYDVSLSALSRFSSQVSGLSSQNHRFLYVGQLIHRKGVDRLLRALAAVLSDAWTLDLVGEGSERAALQQLGSSLGISEQLKWHGSLPSGELASFYQSADCVVLPSRWDGWGMTVNEALRHGCDVLASETCGAASAVPQAARLPKSVRAWPAMLGQQLSEGKLTALKRTQNCDLASQLTGEVGAERLKSILMTGDASND
jgi:glycosyltransferase involved in cell wall biosynthesis